MKSLMSAYVETRSKIQSMLENQKGATMVEYALMVALIAGVAIAAVTLVGTNVTAEFNTIAGKVLTP